MKKLSALFLTFAMVISLIAIPVSATASAVTFDALNDGVGIPEKNPNLSDDSVAKANEVLELIKNGTIQVKSEV